MICNNCFTPGAAGKAPPGCGECGSALVPETVFETHRIDEDSCAALIRRACADFQVRPFVGVRDAAGTFGWKTYGQIWDDALATAAGVLNATSTSLSAGPESPLAPGFRVLVIGDTSPGYVTVILSSLLLGGVLVPVSGQVDDEAIVYIASKAQPTLIFVDDQYRDRVSAAVAQGLPDASPVYLPLTDFETKVLDPGKKAMEQNPNFVPQHLQSVEETIKPGDASAIL